MLIVYVKPASGAYVTNGNGLPANASAAQNADYSQGDWYFSIGNWSAGPNAFINYTPLTINFDNFSGLLSSVTVQELYTMCVKNGLDMDWDTWCGVAMAGKASASPAPWYALGTSAVSALSGNTSALQWPGQQMPTTGSILVLKPSQDITLQSGQSPSLVGNFTLQFNLTVTNQSRFTASPTLYVITANSGFFESIRGSSRIIKGVLSEQDIISAGASGMTGRADLERIVGGAAFKGLSNIVNKAASSFSKHMPKGGAHEAPMADEAPCAPKKVSGGRKGLAARLM